VKPVATNTKEGDANSLMREALGSCRRGFIDVGLFSLFINLLMLVPPLYMLQVYDRVIASRSQETLLMLTLVVVFLFLAMGGLEWVRSRILVRQGNRLDALLHHSVHDATYHRTLASPGAASAQPLEDLATLRQFISGNALFAFFDAPWIPLYLAALALFHPWFGLFALSAGAILIALAAINERLTRPLLAEAGGRHLQSQNLVNGNLRNAEVLHAMGMMPAVFGRWSQSHRDYLSLQSRASDHSGLVTNASKMLRLLFQSLILGLGAYLVLVNELTPGMMIAGSILMGRALAPIDQMINGWKSFTSARHARARLELLLSDAPDDAAPMPLPTPSGALSLEGVSAAPPGAEQATLHDITLTIKPGEQIAVIGPSAAGKSTLARVALGVWPAQAGCVRLDGADITQWDRALLGPFIGYLPQDVELFDGTIAENIARFGQVDPIAVVKAAKIAGVHDMVLRLAAGYDSAIGHGGIGLSAGQRQRIGLARALYGDPVLLVLDEPDASLDQAGEQALAMALDRLRPTGTTVIVVSHRPGLLSRVDRVLLLKEGRIASLAPPQRPHSATRIVASAAESGTRVMRLRPGASGPSSASHSEPPP